ncbi:hypothetical protein THIOM_005217 [Candidatus Thiomargarita nelsonii]|uniref:TIGR02646 family protein n=1 Tax=Candidatus Thiomargarita nelsonii TaxID=1003181 RepID=A0A176RTV2_9GAMM|nr:hypothetical protein THIOM_005217 [Candidatus Thiomargarita nelsonii]
MKKVGQLDTAPTGLQHFLERHSEERNWNIFKHYQDYKNDKNQNADKELINALIERQHGLCAYCEIELTETDSQVEHFHPKSDTSDSINWTFEITNLFAACKGGTAKNLFGENTRFPVPKRFREPTKKNRSCGEPKGNQVPGLDIDILKPSELPPTPPLFSVSRNGAISVNEENCHQAEIDPVKAENTIRELNLNCERLKDARMEVLEKLKNTLENEMIELGETASDEEIMALQVRLAKQFLFEKQEYLGEFFTTIRSYFGLAAEKVLGNSLGRWI